MLYTYSRNSNMFRSDLHGFVWEHVSGVMCFRYIFGEYE